MSSPCLVLTLLIYIGSSYFLSVFLLFFRKAQCDTFLGIILGSLPGFLGYPVLCCK